MGTKHCVQGGNGDDFLSPCSSLLQSLPMQQWPGLGKYSLKAVRVRVWGSYRRNIARILMGCQLLCDDYWLIFVNDSVKKFQMSTILLLRSSSPSSNLWYGGRNSITAKEVSRFQSLFPNPQLVDAKRASGHQKLQYLSDWPDGDYYLTTTWPDYLMVTGPLVVESTLVQWHWRLVVYPGVNVQPWCSAWKKLKFSK